MANSTVYPYGTGGSLPSSIGIINDLTTGGVDKALSAQQGKVLDDKISQLGLETIDLNEFVPVMCIPSASSNKWVSLNTSYPFMGIFIPCNGGEKYLLESPDSDIKYFCLTTPAYVNGTDVDYATGFSGNGKIVPIGGEIITVPADAKYIYIKVSNDGGTTYIGPTRVAVVHDAETIANNVVNSVVANVDSTVSNVARGRYLAGSGAIRTDESWGFTTNYIPVQPGDMVLWRPGVVKSDAYLTFYNSSKAFLTNITANATSRTQKVPANAAYIRAPFALSAINNHPVVVNSKVAWSPVETYPYNGPRYNFDTHYVSWERLMTMSGLNPIPQGGDCFGKYLFQFVANNTIMRVYDLETKAIIDTVDIAEAQRGFVSNCHCNTVTFSNYYYASGDEFPIIYVSTGYASGGYSGAIGYRIQRTDNDFSLTLVHTLKFPAVDGATWTEFVVAGGTCYICYTSLYRAYKFKMPTVSDGETIVFDLNNALEVIQFAEMPASFNGSRYQDRIYHDGRIFAISGVPGDGEKSCLQVLNLATQERESVIDFTEMGLTDESESIFIYNEHLYVSFASSIVQLFFK